MTKIVINNQGELSALLSGLSQKATYPIRIDYSFGSGRSMSQNSLSHVIYSEISKYLISKGRKDCNPEWIKRMLKNQFLGCEDKTYTDLLTGEKSSRLELRHTSSLSVGEMLEYITKILAWAVDIGCEVKMPVNSSYMDLMDKQND